MNGSIVLQTDRHAYLIIAHQHDLNFVTLLELIDDERNDIFIHMDIKNKSYDESIARKIVKKSNLYHTKRTDVTWGGYSQIKVELLLLKNATNCGEYKYYHLLSGEDLPLKTQNQIHSFFSGMNKEYVGFALNQSSINSRVETYHFFQEKIGRFGRKDLSFKKLAYFTAEKISLLFQKCLRIRRNTGIQFAKGSEWFSITDELARYVVAQENWIKKTFRWTVCADEIFLQTIVQNSKFLDKCNSGDEIPSTLRFIDWNRGVPYVFGVNDYSELINSDMLFARKFVSSKDSQIIYKIKEYVMSQNS